MDAIKLLERLREATGPEGYDLARDPAGYKHKVVDLLNQVESLPAKQRRQFVGLTEDLMRKYLSDGRSDTSDLSLIERFASHSEQPMLLSSLLYRASDGNADGIRAVEMCIALGTIPSNLAAKTIFHRSDSMKKITTTSLVCLMENISNNVIPILINYGNTSGYSDFLVEAVSSVAERDGVKSAMKVMAGFDEKTKAVFEKDPIIPDTREKRLIVEYFYEKGIDPESLRELHEINPALVDVVVSALAAGSMKEGEVDKLIAMDEPILEQYKPNLIIVQAGLLMNEGRLTMGGIKELSARYEAVVPGATLKEALHKNPETKRFLESYLEALEFLDKEVTASSIKNWAGAFSRGIAMMAKDGLEDYLLQSPERHYSNPLRLKNSIMAMIFANGVGDHLRSTLKRHGDLGFTDKDWGRLYDLVGYSLISSKNIAELVNEMVSSGEHNESLSTMLKQHFKTFWQGNNDNKARKINWKDNSLKHHLLEQDFHL